jgi:hypothetical protein
VIKEAHRKGARESDAVLFSSADTGQGVPDVVAKGMLKVCGHSVNDGGCEATSVAMDREPTLILRQGSSRAMLKASDHGWRRLAEAEARTLWFRDEVRERGLAQNS